MAVQPSTGDVLAVANRPGDSTYDRALEGRYPPGSTFKVVTTAALLADGLRPDEIVDCPRTIVVGGRSFKNFEGSAQGAVPFSRGLRAVVQHGLRLAHRPACRRPRSATRARDFGLGEPLKLGMPAAEASVPPGDDLVARAAAMIGQNETLASPLAMAGVAATVADGRWHAPRLLAGDPRARRRAARPRGPRHAAHAHARGDHRRHRHRARRHPGRRPRQERHGRVRRRRPAARPTRGSSPTADDVAVAVLVEHGRSGGTVAAPIAARFFAACDAESACG